MATNRCRLPSLTDRRRRFMLHAGNLIEMMFLGKRLEA
jgi:hypothetical protein